MQATTLKTQEDFKSSNETYRGGVETYDNNAYRYGNFHMPTSVPIDSSSTIPPQSKDGHTTISISEMPIKKDGTMIDANSGRSNVDTSHGRGFQSGGPAFFPNTQSHYVNSGVGTPSLQNNDYFNNMHGGLPSSMQTPFPNGAYGYGQADPYYYNYMNYGAPPSNTNYLDPTGSGVPYEAPGAQLNDNQKRSIHSNGSDFQSDSYFQEKRMRVGNEMYSRFPGHFNDYGVTGNPAQQMMAMQQHGNYLNSSMDNSVNVPLQTKSAKPSKSKKQYSGDMPRRPLTAYNFFFSEEREFILAQLPDEEEAKNQEDLHSTKNGDGHEDSERGADEEIDPMEKILASMRELSEEEKKELRSKVRANTERMLTIHKESERVKKPHKKVHGKIPFRYLAKIVGTRWRNLPADRKKIYEDIAAKDSSRYNEHLAEYNKNNK